MNKSLRASIGVLLVANLLLACANGASTVEIHGVLRAANKTWVCLNVPDQPQRRWLAPGEACGGWTVDRIGANDAVTLHAETGERLEIPPGPSDRRPPEPALFDPEWVLSSANSSLRRPVLFREEWAFLWRTMTDAERTKIVDWFHRHGTDIEIREWGHAIHVSERCAVADRIEEIQRARQLEYERTLTPEQWAVLKDLRRRSASMVVSMASLAQERETGVKPPPPPSPAEWAAFEAMLTAEQLVLYRRTNTPLDP